MDPFALRAAFRVAILVLIAALVMLPFQPPASAEFVARVPFAEGDVDEARVFVARADEIALISERGGKAAMRGEIRGGDLDRVREECHRARTITGACVHRSAVAEVGKGAIAVAELEERSRETAMGVDIVVLLD